MINAIIFDMDGVLIDSPQFVWRTHNKLLTEHNKQVPDEEIRKYLGRSLNDQISLFEKNFGISIDKEEYKEKFMVNMQHEFEHLENSPSLSSLLTELQNLRLKLAVATSNTKARAEHILQHLGVADFFDVFVTSEDVLSAKPAPDVFLKAAEKLNIAPKECMVVEDALNGIQSAKNANMKVIALVTAFLKRNDLEEADYVVDTLDEIKEIIRQDTTTRKEL